jgi:hypothetical protein
MKEKVLLLIIIFVFLQLCIGRENRHIFVLTATKNYSKALPNADMIYMFTLSKANVDSPINREKSFFI